jgi:hypothetical protein
VGSLCLSSSTQILERLCEVHLQNARASPTIRHKIALFIGFAEM